MWQYLTWSGCLTHPQRNSAEHTLSLDSSWVCLSSKIPWGISGDHVGMNLSLPSPSDCSPKWANSFFIGTCTVHQGYGGQRVSWMWPLHKCQRVALTTYDLCVLRGQMESAMDEASTLLSLNEMPDSWVARPGSPSGVTQWKHHKPPSLCLV